ncbi:uncharacterized protein [Palaemon carinicauda]|uniref:uncharacterized protein n=1 Tax=Palaemon carinicauda TaxID=392227 RepID=UPI0035B58E7F
MNKQGLDKDRRNNLNGEESPGARVLGVLLVSGIKEKSYGLTAQTDFPSQSKGSCFDMACLKFLVFFLTALALMPMDSAEAADHKIKSGHGYGYSYGYSHYYPHHGYKSHHHYPYYPHHGYDGAHHYPHYPHYAPYHSHSHHGSPSSYSYVNVHHGPKAAERK